MQILAERSKRGVLASEMTLPWMLGTEWPRVGGYLDIVLPPAKKAALGHNYPACWPVHPTCAGETFNVSLTCLAGPWKLTTYRLRPPALIRTSGTWHAGAVSCARFDSFQTSKRFDRKKSDRITFSFPCIGSVSKREGGSALAGIQPLWVSVRPSSLRNAEEISVARVSYSFRCSHAQTQSHSFSVWINSRCPKEFSLFVHAKKSGKSTL